MDFAPRNILVLNSDRLGDAALALPALRALRERFPRARITATVAASAVPLLELAGYTDKVVAVEYAVKGSHVQPFALMNLARVVQALRREKFDLVVDLHGSSQTNLLGYLSGAPQRLYARRADAALSLLANFQPPPEIEDKTKHPAQRYISVLAPLGVRGTSPILRLRTRPEDDRAVAEILRKAKVPEGAPLVGIFPGANDAGARWPLERFHELADHLERNDSVRSLVLLGPQERALTTEARRVFGSTSHILDALTLPQLASLSARLAAFASNAAAPAAIAALVGTPVVALLNSSLSKQLWLPVGTHHRIVRASQITNITVEHVYTATRAALTQERASTLFASG